MLYPEVGGQVKYRGTMGDRFAGIRDENCRKMGSDEERKSG